MSNKINYNLFPRGNNWCISINDGEYTSFFYDIDKRIASIITQLEKENRELQNKLDFSEAVYDELDNRNNITIKYLEQEKENHLNNVKLCETNLDNLLISSAVATCHHAIRKLKGEEDE